MDKIQQLFIGSPCANLECMQTERCVAIHRWKRVVLWVWEDRRVLGIAGRGQGYFDARVVPIDVLIQMRFHDAVVVDPKSLTESILRNLESTVDVSPQG